MRKFYMVVRVAMKAVLVHKMRSFLTMLGVVIGVGAVIALVAVGEGTQAQVVSQFEALGSNLLTVSPGTSFGFSRGGLQTNSKPLVTADVEAIQALASAVAKVAPQYNANATVTYGANTTNISINGVTSVYADVRAWTVTSGRFISDADDANLATVVVLGQTAVEDLFGSAQANPVGEIVRINRQNYTVIGVLGTKGQSGFNNQDNVIFMPLHTTQLKLGGAGTTTVNQISLQVRSAEEMDLAQAQVTAIMRSRHGLTGTAADDFTVQNQADIVSTVSETSQTFTTLLGSIAAISLLVGGIGIMNIMLVSVTERTREIGLRKAVGAKRADILIQFLAEAIVLSVVGGLLGVAAGVGSAQAIAPLLGSAQAVVTSQSVFLALGVSLGIGVFFGLYPANRAAKLKPIDALHYE
ncbi:MAG: ABC transporter permease [Caldilineaceae bacterium]|nr:ABC transporter permease [Caldilineaceae bacterium]MBP8108196.1 ABC transporter permease [Caldilineaceae bacterium]MBP8124240.1 ABC transporter permease [Caldilineaceae bacterium]MBP9074212.1 ABC transporter permease [Caldilineaceae bacterium]